MKSAARSKILMFGSLAGSTITVMQPGTRVEVRRKFDDHWSRGFEIHEIVEANGDPVRYRLRRRSDESLLPVLFDAEDVREERRRNKNMWWV